MTCLLSRGGPAGKVPHFWGGLLWRNRFAGPVFRFGQNPVLGFRFGLKVSDVRVRAISCRYRNEPATAFYHLGFKLRDRLSHCRNMRLWQSTFQSGTLPQSNWLGLGARQTSRKGMDF